MLQRHESFTAQWQIVIVRVDYFMCLFLFSVSESVETGITLFVSNHLDRASM